ncbi:uncharacterized protein LOC112213780 [Bombus impatiens]|uniref:Uncharacterized protein LOC112213780 n=1 Tax=Bombus impatiens TaxID=132113 RepID=A0A6P6FGJ8_BOMIM|nr:uncharacterized protein LOC112213780 [Bombus impatiens]
MDIALCVRELGTIEKTLSMDILAYCGKIQVLFDKLSKAGIKFEDNVVASFILTGLATDQDYPTYVEDKNLTSRSVKADLLLEEKSINALAPRRQWKPRSVPKQRWREAEEQKHK